MIFLMSPNKFAVLGRHIAMDTLPETNIAPEYRWLEDEIPFGMAYG